MNDLANVILSKLIFYEYLDPFNKIDIYDLKENIYNMWKEYKYVEDIINAGYNLDYIVNDEQLLNEILELVNADIDDQLELDGDYEELLENQIEQLNNELDI